MALTMSLPPTSLSWTGITIQQPSVFSYAVFIHVTVDLCCDSQTPKVLQPSSKTQPKTVKILLLLNSEHCSLIPESSLARPEAPGWKQVLTQGDSGFLRHDTSGFLAPLTCGFVLEGVRPLASVARALWREQAALPPLALCWEGALRAHILGRGSASNRVKQSPPIEP